MSNSKKIAYSVSVQYIGRILGLVVSLFAIALLTRNLGVANYGAYAAAASIANLIITFSDFGFFWSTIQNYFNPEGNKDSIRDILGIRTILTIALILISIIFVKFGAFSPVVKEAYIILTIFVFTSSINNILIAIYQAEYRMLWPTIADIIGRFVNLIIIYIGIRYKLPFNWFIWGMSTTALINLLINWLGLIKSTGLILPKFRGITWRKYYNSVFLVGLMALFSALYFRIDIVILSWMKNSEDVGIYGVAQRITELSTVFGALLISSVFPTLVTSFKVDLEKFKSMVGKTFLILLAIGLPIFIYGVFLSQQLVDLIGGNQFTSIATIIVRDNAITTPVVTAILLFYVFLVHLGIVFTNGLLASGAVKRLVIINITATIVNIVLNIIFIPTYSYFACAIITVLTEMVVVVANGGYFIKKYNFKFPWASAGKIILSIIPGLIFLYAFSFIPFIILSILIVIIYFATLYLLMPEFRLFAKQMNPGAINE